jgi:hypothetical protein
MFTVPQILLGLLVQVYRKVLWVLAKEAPDILNTRRFFGRSATNYAATRRNIPEDLNLEKQNCSIMLLGPATRRQRGDADEKYIENFGEAS